MTIRKDFVDNGFGQQNCRVFPNVHAYERNIITRRKDGGGVDCALQIRHLMTIWRFGPIQFDFLFEIL